jgi:hypothetical protein
VVACHPEQGWSLLCNGVVLFDDAGILVLAGPVPDPAPVPDPGRLAVTRPAHIPALSRAAA